MLRDYVALTKPGVTFEVLVTTAGGLWLASTSIGPGRAAMALAGTALVVGAANTLNCWYERDSDRHMTRTRDRPLPAGRMSARAALWFGLGLAALSLPLLWAVGPITALVGAASLVVYTCVYTPMKRRSSLALLVGAVPGAAPPLMGWAAATGEIDLAGLALFAILYVWQLPHFLAIAIRRRDEYTRAGLRTVPGDHGVHRAARLAVLTTLLLIPVSLAPAFLGVAGPLYAAVAGVLGLAWLLRAAPGWGARATDPAWAGRLFGDSLVYLLALFVALPFDALIR